MTPLTDPDHPKSYDRYQSRHKLLAAAAGWFQSEQYHQYSEPGPYDDADAELMDDRLLIAAREFVEAHDGVKAIPG